MNKINNEVFFKKIFAITILFNMLYALIKGKQKVNQHYMFEFLALYNSRWYIISIITINKRLILIYFRFIEAVVHEMRE